MSWSLGELKYAGYLNDGWQKENVYEYLENAWSYGEDDYVSIFTKFEETDEGVFRTKVSSVGARPIFGSDGLPTPDRHWLVAYMSVDLDEIPINEIAETFDCFSLTSFKDFTKNASGCGANLSLLGETFIRTHCMSPSNEDSWFEVASPEQAMSLVRAITGCPVPAELFTKAYKDFEKEMSEAAKAKLDETPASVAAKATTAAARTAAGSADMAHEHVAKL